MRNSHTGWLNAIAVLGAILLSSLTHAAAPTPADGFNVGLRPVYAVQVQKDGKILIGGGFQGTFAGSALSRIARLNADGSIDASFNPGLGADDRVNAIALQPDGKVLIAGAFRSVNRVAAPYIARLNQNGSLDTTFHSAIDPTSNGITALCLDADGKVLVGGAFKTVGGVARPFLARLNTDGSLDAEFNPTTLTEKKYLIRSIVARPDGTVIAAGASSSYITSTPRDIFLQAFDYQGMNSRPLASLYQNPCQIGRLIPQPDGKMLVAAFWGSTVSYYTLVWRTKSDGSTDMVFPRLENDITLEGQQSDGKILVSTRFNGETRQLKRLNADGSLDSAYRCNLKFLQSDIYQTAAVQQPDGKIIFAAASGGVFRLNLDGSLDADFNRSLIDSVVRAIAIQPDGKIVIGGDFSLVQGIGRNHIARLNPDLSIDLSFNPGSAVEHPVNSLKIQADGKVLAIEDLSTTSTINLRLIRLKANGSLDAGFIPEVEDVRMVEPQPDGKIVAYGGIPYSSSSGLYPALIRLKSDGSLDAELEKVVITSFFIQPDGKIVYASYNNWISSQWNFNGPVSDDWTVAYTRAYITRITATGMPDKGADIWHLLFSYINLMALQNDGRILFGGGDAYVDTWSTRRIRRLNADMTLDLSYIVTTDCIGPMRAIVPLANGKVLLGGNFTKVNGVLCNGIARLNEDGSVDAAFNSGGSGPNGEVNAIAVESNGKILIGGLFASFNGVARPGFARLNGDGSLDAGIDAINNASDGTIGAIATQPDGRVLLGGEFTRFSNLKHDGIARVGADGGIDVAFNPGVRQASAIAALPGGKTLVCGNRSDTGSNFVVARLNSDGTTDSTFATSRVDGTINCVALQPDGKAIIGGQFQHVNGTERKRLARLNGDGSLDTRFQFNPASSGPIYSVALQPNGKLVVAGDLTFYFLYSTRKYLARLESSGATDLTFDVGPGPDGLVVALALDPDGKVLVAGDYSRINGVPRNGLARLRADGTVDSGFVPDAEQFNYFNTLALQSDGKVLAGGFFSCQNKGYGRIVRLDRHGAFDAIFDAPWPMFYLFNGLDGIALQSDGKVLAGGFFDKLGGMDRHYLGRVSNPDAALQAITVDAEGKAVTWALGGSFPWPHQVLFEQSADGANWIALGRGTNVPGVGYRLSDINLPIGSIHFVRATGWTTGGQFNGSVSAHSATLRFSLTPRNTATDWLDYE